jgi:hypothetical protein
VILGLCSSLEPFLAKTRRPTEIEAVGKAVGGTRWGECPQGASREIAAAIAAARGAIEGLAASNLHIGRHSADLNEVQVRQRSTGKLRKPASELERSQIDTSETKRFDQ